MIYLNEINLEEERREMNNIIQLQDELDKRKFELRSRLKEKAKVYYGNEKGSEYKYMKDTPAKFFTEDGYAVELKDYEIYIAVPVGNRVFKGYGTRYDKESSDLTFYLKIGDGDYRKGYAKKYEKIRNRMKEIQAEYCIENPFKEFEATVGCFIY